jgi:tetratricopeptide (TPR) repeat protein
MIPNQSQTLIDHLDNNLQGNKSSEMEQKISNDPEAAQEWVYIRLAVDAVQDAGLYNQVATVKSAWQAQQSSATKPGGAIVHTIYRNVLRVAACIFILSGGAALYKYTTTSSDSVYNKYYTSYSLNASRGASTQDAQEQAYSNKNWADALSLFDKSKEKSNKSYFIAGMADLELKKYDDAIAKFQHIIAANVLSGADYFQDEAEFYLAMSWLGRGDANEALPLLDKIKANKSHLYHDVVLKMSSLDLRIIQYKSGK